MFLTDGAAPQMPIRLPDAESIRRQIANIAASLRGEPAERYLGLLGEVEPTWPSTNSDTPWRLSFYLGAYEDGLAIERAVAVVLRRTPLMRVR
jgi:hypothetical protein